MWKEKWIVRDFYEIHLDKCHSPRPVGTCKELTVCEPMFISAQQLIITQNSRRGCVSAWKPQQVRDNRIIIQVRSKHKHHPKRLGVRQPWYPQNRQGRMHRDTADKGCSNDSSLKKIT